MKKFESITIDIATLFAELDDLQKLLDSTTALKERSEIAPFFKARKNLCAALGLMNSAVAMTDLVASELDLFGDFVCDAAAGDSSLKAYTLIEFEDATEFSVLSKLQGGKTVKRWSPRFEHGFSQLIDWAWRLSNENTSHAYRRIFEHNDATIHFLLIAGRDSDLNDDDLARLRWRANNIHLGAFRMTCLTFDGVLSTLRRRFQFASYI